MAEYRRSEHAVYDLKCHLIWVTKYRYKVLHGRVAERARDVIRQICAPSLESALSREILSGGFSRNATFSRKRFHRP